MPDSLGDRIGPDEVFSRFVLSFATPEEDVDAFVRLVAEG
jgi:threonine aldolase